MHLHPFLYEIRSAFIFIGGLGIVFVTNEIKKRMNRVNDLWKEKTEIEGLFGQQVSPQVAEVLLQDHDHIHKTNVTIIFLDIRNFTPFSERLDPQEVNDFQNNLFCPLIEIINTHDGIINQIIGDGFMAIFGAPVQDQNHTKKAVESALDMLEDVKHLILSFIVYYLALYWSNYTLIVADLWLENSNYLIICKLKDIVLENSQDRRYLILL